MSRSLFRVASRPCTLQSSILTRQFTSSISRCQPPPSDPSSRTSSPNTTSASKLAQMARDVTDSKAFMMNLPLTPDIYQMSATPRGPFHLHCYTTKHNTHVTLTNDKRDAIISISCGNLGFKKGARGTYEAAFQTSAWVMRQMHEMKLLDDESHPNYIYQLEIVLRGFGEGREAFKQALMGIEGRNIRPKVCNVSDSTRIKFGGARSPNPRRLG